jgi:hypothetical protein
VDGTGLVVGGSAHSLGERAVDQPAEVFLVTKSVLATVVLLAIVDGWLGLENIDRTPYGGQGLPVIRKLAAELVAGR